MTDQEYRKLRFEYWKLLVAQKANVDEFGEKSQNIEQRRMQMEEVFWALVIKCRKPPDFNLGI